MKTYLTQATIASFGQKVAISGGATAVFGGLTANDLAAMCGAFAGLGGLLVQFIFSLLRWRTERKDKYEEKQQQAQRIAQQAQYTAQENQRKEELHALEVQQRLLNLERLRQEVSGEQA